MRALLSTACIAGAALSMLANPVRAETVGDFYNDRTVTILVSTGPGGGYELYSRTLAAHYGKHIPGKPHFILSFMPGAGGLKAGAYLYNVAPKDGSMIGMLSTGLPLMQVVKGHVRYDVAKFNYIGRIAAQNAVSMVWHTAPATTLKAARTTELIFGGTGKAQQGELHPNAMKNVLGFTKFRIISGYKGSASVVLALEKGEVSALCTAWSSWKGRYSRLMKDKKVIPLVEHGIEKAPDGPPVPLDLDLAKNDFQRQVLTLIDADAAVGRLFALPPGAPKDRVAALRAAFDATMKDPEFLADAKKRKMDVWPKTGAEMQKLMTHLTAVTPAVAAAAKKAVGL